MSISLICTVLNEGASLQKLLHSISRQTRLPDEIVFVDGGSRDDTVSLLQQFAAQQPMPVRVIIEPGANISRGRNVAIESATGPIIACTDAGVRLDEQWLERLTRPFETVPRPHVVAGFFLPDPQSTFEVAMGATVLPTVAEIDPNTFLPSSRSIAFLKSSWQAAGKYPEWLDYCEDLIFDIRLRAINQPFIFVPEALVYFRPRGHLRAFFKQYYCYARGDGKADLWRKRHAIRYGTYLLGLPLLLLLGGYHARWWWLVTLFLSFGGLFLTPYRRLMGQWDGLSQGQKWAALAYVPLIRVTGDIAKMIGYPVGWLWRLARINRQSELRWRG